MSVGFCQRRLGLTNFQLTNCWLDLGIFSKKHNQLQEQARVAWYPDTMEAMRTLTRLATGVKAPYAINMVVPTIFLRGVGV